MFLTADREKLVRHIKELAEKNHFGVAELSNDGNNIVHIQPYDLTSQVGPDNELVKKFNRLVQSRTPKGLRERVYICIKSKSSGRNPDYSQSEPDLATPQEIHFIELRFY